MADLTNDIKLAIDTGSVSFGIREVTRNIHTGKAKAVIVANSGKERSLENIRHLCSLAGIKYIRFNGNPTELAVICGKPFSVSCLSIEDPGASKILEENY